MGSQEKNIFHKETMAARVSIVYAAPGLPEGAFDQATKDTNAVIFVVFATGTSPEYLNGVIAQRVAEGIPVFLVSNNPGDTHGILRITYGVQEASAKAGATSLQKVNVNNLEEIQKAIEDAFKEGKKGTALAEAIFEKFAYKEGEQKPVPSWENPEHIAKEEELYRNTLKRQSIHPDEIEKEIKKWRGDM